MTKGHQVAAYWDFENMHASVLEAKQGEGSYAQSRGTQPAVLDVGAICRHLESLGTVVVHRAFADWRSFGVYRPALLNHRVDCVQVFAPGSNGKNSADIRMVIDALRDSAMISSITDVVIISCDIDFAPLATQLKRQSKRVHGIGVRGSTSRFWPKACDGFRFYRDLVESAKNGGRQQGPSVEARTLLIRALQAAARGQEDFWLRASVIGIALREIDAEFRPQRFGHRTLTPLLKSFPDIIEVRNDDGQVTARLRRPQAAA